jgi:ABC-type phosphate transport system ATPase subunit/ubiquitin-protein ligase
VKKKVTVKSRTKALMGNFKRCTVKDVHPHIKFIIHDDVHNWYFMMGVTVDPGNDGEFSGNKDEFLGGQFFGKITATKVYPFGPPDVEMLTPTGVFPLNNNNFCIDIGKYHKNNYPATLGMDGYTKMIWSGLVGWRDLGHGINLISGRTPQNKQVEMIRKASFESLRGQMALVSQEIVVFNQSVADNIACGKLDATREDIIAAARAANAHEFIEGLPEGYDTHLGEQGTRLSGGQRQRIAIARAFVRQAPILILDEATASLDSKAEAEVQGAIDRVEEGRTVVCVAHRLSTLRSMDRIIVLDAGRVVESGGFAELMERNGAFAAMARKQGITSSSA